MKTVYLLRHAKSDWADARLKDHERPLNDRGQKAAPQMGAYLKSKRYKPDIILCSTARRAVETLDLAKPAFAPETPVLFEETLYLAEPRQLLERLRWLDEGEKSVLIVGHNPGIAQFALDLSASPANEADEAVHRRLREKYSTGALAVVKLPINAWREIKNGQGRLVDFTRPKDL